MHCTQWLLCSHAGVVPAERRADGPEEALHQGGDGQGPDGEEPVQGEADGAAGGRQVDGDDPVRRVVFRMK